MDVVSLSLWRAICVSAIRCYYGNGNWRANMGGWRDQRWIINRARWWFIDSTRRCKLSKRGVISTRNVVIRACTQRNMCHGGDEQEEVVNCERKATCDGWEWTCVDVGVAKVPLAYANLIESRRNREWNKCRKLSRFVGYLISHGFWKRVMEVMEKS